VFRVEFMNICSTLVNQLCASVMGAVYFTGAHRGPFNSLNLRAATAFDIELII